MNAAIVGVGGNSGRPKGANGLMPSPMSAKVEEPFEGRGRVLSTLWVRTYRSAEVVHAIRGPRAGGCPTGRRTHSGPRQDPAGASRHARARPRPDRLPRRHDRSSLGGPAAHHGAEHVAVPPELAAPGARPRRIAHRTAIAGLRAAGGSGD